MFILMSKRKKYILIDINKYNNLNDYILFNKLFKNNFKKIPSLNY